MLLAGVLAFVYSRLHVDTPPDVPGALRWNWCWEGTVGISNERDEQPSLPGQGRAGWRLDL